MYDGHQWIRIHSGMGPMHHPVYTKKYEARKNTIKNPVFLAACTKAKIEPSIRQARKWNMKKGLAYRHR